MKLFTFLFAIAAASMAVVAAPAPAEAGAPIEKREPEPVPDGHGGRKLCSMIRSLLPNFDYMIKVNALVMVLYIFVTSTDLNWLLFAYSAPLSDWPPPPQLYGRILDQDYAAP
ncbi:predicted protein [Uncinocarpus reesii 1704]|uniref:Uncharacterized protein n=1 Tax=Uncinocarpus reesii (strain UAMH 1704) TaxID=336963 RepID=C4JJ43_UNCRE|nr:uncharacterized protein UREG_01650 [Uncinocarpus reesii 1704]EEP76801.1 predicted protein [Uncinocarpus reesii 1704]